MDANELIRRMEKETGQRIDDKDSFALAGVLGYIARTMGKSNHDTRDDVAAGSIIRHEMTPEFRQEERSKRQFDRVVAGMLISGVDPDDIKKIF